jgi:hypothetical protein
MAELERDPATCCAPEQQTSCCEPQDKDGCCTPGESSCGCGADGGQEGGAFAHDGLPRRLEIIGVPLGSL